MTVVVVTYNARRHLDALLASVDAATQHRPATVVAVDNGSSDGTVEYLRRFAHIRLVEQINTGYASGVNRGIESAAEGDDILVLNPDVVLAHDALERLCSVLADSAEAGVVVPQLQDEFGRTLPSLRRDPSLLGTLVEAVVGGSRAGRFGEAFIPARSDIRQDVDWATGAVLLLRRELIEEIGPLDESFFLYSEETEYCRRARDAGWRVVCESRAIAQHVGGDLGQDPRLWALRAVNRVRLYRRSARNIVATAFRLASIAFEYRRVISGDRVSRVALWALMERDLDASASRLIRAVGGELR